MSEKDRGYHQSAIIYNQELAELAEDLTERVDNDIVKRWCQSVAKQRRFHEDRHRKALEKLNSHGGKTVETEDGGEDRVIEEDLTIRHDVAPAEDDPTVQYEVSRSAVSGQFVSDEEAEENPDTTVTETVERASGDVRSPFEVKENKDG